MAKFIISSDTSCDHYKSYLAKNNVYCIVMKRILGDAELAEHYDSPEEFEAFYETLKKGALPKTAALNPQELIEYFQDILKKEKDGDIIHIALSSGLSVTCDSACKAAEEVNKGLKGRKIYIIDSLIATHGIAHQIDELIKLRDKGVSSESAIKQIESIRDHQQGWVIMNDLMHLKRGGRISGAKAAIGTLLGVKPIICVNNKGKLVIENKMRGSANAVNYVLGKMKELGEKASSDFAHKTIYLVRCNKSKLFDDLKEAVTAAYPKVKVEERIVGPIIGTHLGCDGAFILFEGAKRLTISDK
jgi:DegV family protein with EDD domain